MFDESMANTTDIANIKKEKKKKKKE